MLMVLLTAFFCRIGFLHASVSVTLGIVTNDGQFEVFALEALYHQYYPTNKHGEAKQASNTGSRQ